MDYKQLAQEQEEYVISMRRQFHEHPEVSWKEDWTIAHIAQELTTYGISYVEVPNGGIFAFLGNSSKGKTVLLRGDVDALPGKESPVNAGGRPKAVVSQNDAASHTCGHDAHTAMLLGAARVLKAHEDEIPGQVVCMFERGEESGGNIAYLLRWAYENDLHVDTSFAMHGFPEVPVGKVALCTGTAMAGNLVFQVKLTGKTAHGSQPSEGTNPIDCFTAIVNTLQTIRMRYINAQHTSAFSLGTVHAGNAANIIPAELTFAGGFRFSDVEDGITIKEHLVDTLEKTAEIYGCKAEYSITGPMLPCRNDPACTEFARQILKNTFGKQVLMDIPSMMGSDTNGLTQSVWPGVYMFLGIGNEGKGMTAKIHHECFEPDEDALAIGVACHLAYALEFMKNGPETSSRIFGGDLREYYQKNAPWALMAYQDGIL